MATKSNPLRKINTRKLRTVSEAGDIRGDADITCWLDPRGVPSFVYLLPEYVGEALDIKDCRVSQPTAEAALAEYDRVLLKYQDHVRTLKAEPVVIVRMEYSGVSADDRLITHEKHGGTRSVRMVSLEYELAFRVGSSIHGRKEVYGPDTGHGWRGPVIGWKPGSRRGYISGKVLPHSDELVAKLDRVMEAINGAAQVLHEIHSAQDVTAALMSLGNGSMLALPAPVALSGSSKQPDATLHADTGAPHEDATSRVDNPSFG